VKFFRRLIYFFRRAVENVFENPFLNAVTIGIIAATLFLFSNFLLVLNDLNVLFDLWGRGIRIVAYANPDFVTPGDQSRLIQNIQDRPEVEKVEFISKSEALRRFQKILKGNEQIIRDLQNENPLPESYEIHLKKAFRSREKMQSLATWLSQKREIEDVVYGQEWVERFTTAMHLLRIIGGVFGGLLILAAVFIISSTIKITLYARKKELEIMQLVGATNFFIKIPFVLEGIFQGLLGAALAVGGCYLFFQALMGKMVQVFAMPEFPFLPISTIAAILVGGMLLGASGSIISVGRFLKES
jgi:cell division transport system permease protein